MTRTDRRDPRGRRLACAAAIAALAVVLGACGDSDEAPPDKAEQVRASLIGPLFLEQGDSLLCESTGPGDFVETETFRCELNDKGGGYGRGTINVLLDNNQDMLEYKLTLEPARNTVEGTARLLADPEASE